MHHPVPLLVKLLPFYGILTILIGYFVVSSTIDSYTYHMQALAAQESLSHTKISSQAVVFGIPTEIIIPSLDLVLQVKPGRYNSQKNEWEISSSAAHYATITAPVNNSQGNTVIYAHNSATLFGKLPKLSKGSIVYIKIAYGRTFAYRLSSTTQVVPTDTSVFSQHSTKPLLTLITCSGTWNEKRSLLTFDLEEVYE